MIIKETITGQELFDIRKSVNWTLVKTVEQLDKSLKNSMYVIGIYEDDLLVATGRMVGDFATKGMLTDIIVHPDYQNKGYGKIMVQNLMNRAYDDLKENEVICIEASPTKGNRDFYVQCGLIYNPEEQDGVYVWLEK